MQFDVTFKFENCSATVTVDAPTWMQAVAKARVKEYPPVPDDIPATVEYSGPGGKRQGAGVKQGSIRTAEPRKIKRQICWTEKEWAQIEAGAKEAGLSSADYQRGLILNGGSK